MHQRGREQDKGAKVDAQGEMQVSVHDSGMQAHT